MRKSKLFFVILLCLGIAFSLFFFRYRSFKKEEIPPPPAERFRIEEKKAYLKVGGEIIYGRDLNKMLQYFYPRFWGKEKIPENIKEGIYQKAIEHSVLLQEAEKEEWITLSKEVFNSPKKNYYKRNPLIELAKRKVRQNKLRLLQGRYVSIWFYNVEPPEIGVEKTKSIAKKKIERIYQKLISKEMTFEEAGQKLYRDDELLHLTEPHAPIPENLEEIRKDIKKLPQAGGFYGKFYLGGERKKGIAFHEENRNLEQKIREMEVGETSEILVGRDGGYYKGQAYYDAFFIIFTLDKIENKENPETLQAWLDTKKEEINIVYY